MNFLTNTSLSLSVHLQSRGGKDEDGDQAMGICFSPENHLEVYLFLNLHNTTVTDGHTHVNVNSRTFLTVMK